MTLCTAILHADLLTDDNLLLKKKQLTIIQYVDNYLILMRAIEGTLYKVKVKSNDELHA